MKHRRLSAMDLKRKRTWLKVRLSHKSTEAVPKYPEKNIYKVHPINSILKIKKKTFRMKTS